MGGQLYSKACPGCCDGKHFDDATLVVRKAGENPVEYIKIKMEEVLITSVSTGGSGGEDRLTENVTLNFSKVSWTIFRRTTKVLRGRQFR